MHLADFLGLAAAGQPQLGAALAALSHLPPSASHCLLSGPERSGKTSLLFHAALSLARQGREVLLLCRRAKLEAAPPLLPEGLTHSDPAWQLVHIKYLANGYELLRYASCIHMLPRLPDALLVDDLHALCDLPAGARPRPRDMALCRVLASLHEAANVVAALKQGPCQLLVTQLSPPEGPRQLYMLQRWLPLVLHIRPTGQSLALAVLNPRLDVPPACLQQLQFSLKHGGLTLEAMLPPQTHPF
ncbi:hypothetical protein ABPG75_007922 [Micractinium tetrahymenae]